MTDKKIFTFWEPKELMPEYIKLCIKTWHKFLPEYEIIVLDYSNLDKYIGENYFDKILYKRFSLPMQSDAIRCAVLKKYGGIWMDADTIITSDKVKQILDIQTDFLLVEHHIGFIKADKNSFIIKMWEKELHQRLFQFKYYKNFAKIFNKKYYKKLKEWNYLGNGIINKYLQTEDKNIFFRIKVEEKTIFPENHYYKNENLSPEICYNNFYFKNNFIDFVLDHNDGIIMLHNSWTPEYYKKLSKEKVLEENNTLSNVLRHFTNNL